MTTPHDNHAAAPGADAAGAAEPEEPEPRGEAGRVQARIRCEIVEDDAAWAAIAGAEALILGAIDALAELPDAAARLEQRDSEIVVVLSSDATVAELNERFRGKAYPTNVLSFPAPDLPAGVKSDGMARSLGDVVLAAETVIAEAAEMGIPVAHHLQHLVVHGALHLLGYDHLEAKEAEEMEERERAILATIGVPDPYAGSDPIPDIASNGPATP
ncbi:MAG: rRNA maturation RNase YbeY [Hyphomicrobiaceae bacterium]